MVAKRQHTRLRRKIRPGVLQPVARFAQTFAHKDLHQPGVFLSQESAQRANELAVTGTGIPVDPTGSAGLGGLLEMRRRGEVGDDDRVAVLFTGARR